MGSLLKKILIILVLLLVSIIPLNAVEGLIEERSIARHAAERDIAASWAEGQTISGPLVIIPYRVEVFKEEKVQNATGHPATVTNRYEFDRIARFPPEAVTVKGDVLPAVRYRGIHTVNTYTTQLEISGNVTLTPPVKDSIYRDAKVIRVGAPQIVFALSSPRGIDGTPTLTWKPAQDTTAKEASTNTTPDTAITLRPGTEPDIHTYGSGFHAILPKVVASETMEFSLRLGLRGTRFINFVPVGKDYGVSLRSSWPHPKFTGAFLPSVRTVQDDGFFASWSVTELAMGTAANAPKTEFAQSSQFFGVELFEPVNSRV